MSPARLAARGLLSNCATGTVENREGRPMLLLREKRLRDEARRLGVALKDVHGAIDVRSTG